MGVFLCEFESRHPHKKQRPDFRSLFLFYKPGLRRYKQETEADDSVSVSMSRLFDDYRTFTSHISKFVEFIRWYEQKYDKKPWQ